MGSLTPEGKRKKQVTAVLKDIGAYYFSPMTHGFGKSGVPDIVACINGTFVGIEVKADETKKPTALQVHNGELILQAGGLWCLVRTDEDVAALKVILCSLSNNQKQ